MMIFSKLPNVAKDQFVLESIVEELFHTNELEGVGSSKVEIANSVRNEGEMNFFIDTFLYIILDTLEEMKHELKEKMLLLDSVNEKISRVTHLQTKNEVNCLYILAQHHFFGFTEGMTTKELADVMDMSQNTIRKITKHLLDKSFIKQQGVRPAYFSIDEDFLESE